MGLQVKVIEGWTKSFGRIISFDVQTGSLRVKTSMVDVILFLLVYSSNQPHLTLVLKVSIGVF